MLRNQKGKENGRKGKLILRVGTYFFFKVSVADYLSWDSSENVMGEIYYIEPKGLIFFFLESWGLSGFEQGIGLENLWLGAVNFFILLHFPQSLLWTCTRLPVITSGVMALVRGKTCGNPLSAFRNKPGLRNHEIPWAQIMTGRQTVELLSNLTAWDWAVETESHPRRDLWVYFF